jgi:FixJ family two-component response regulator
VKPVTEYQLREAVSRLLQGIRVKERSLHEKEKHHARERLAADP